jgi:outer membrane protein TolC
VAIDDRCANCECRRSILRSNKSTSGRSRALCPRNESGSRPINCLRYLLRGGLCRPRFFITALAVSKRVLTLLVVLAGELLTHARAAEPTVLSYEEARSTLYAVSDTRKASEAAVSHSEDNAHAVRWLGMPDLSVSTAEVFGEKTGRLDGTPLGSLSFSDNLRGPRSSVNSTWTIYSGGRITATQKALASGVDAASAELTHTEEDLDVQLAREYFGLELAANVEHTREAVLEQADRQLDRAIRIEQQGLIPHVERLNAQVERDEAARDQVSAQRDREIAEASLRRLLHRDTVVGTSTPLFISTQPLKPLTEWLLLAERANPTLAALAAKRSQAEQGVTVAQSSWKPEVFAFGSYSLIKKYQTLIEPDWIAGVGVSFKLFSHEDRAATVSSAREALREVQSLEAAADTGIATQVESMYRKVEQAREQFKLLDSTIALAEENLRLRERGFGEGQATSLDVSDARNSLARSQTARAVAAYDFVVALVQLLEAAGQTPTLADIIQQADVRLPQ